MTETENSKPKSSVSRNIPQWQNDIAVVIRVALGGRKYLLLPPHQNNDNKFTHKMGRQFGRVAKSVGLTLTVGTTMISLRDDKHSRGAPALVYTSDINSLATSLLELYRERGGRMP